MKNIVFVTADQLGYNRCGYGGDKNALTPNIDKFASESVDFYNCVASHPVCAAFRASLFTGKYTTSTGMVINEVRLNPDHHKNAFPIVLGKQGYRAELIGKWHLWANNLGDFKNVKNSFVPKGEYRFGFDGFFAHCNMHHEYYKAFYHLDDSEKIFIDGYEPDVQTDMAIQRLTLAKKENAPIALFLQFGTPHDPWSEDNVPKEYLDKFKDAEFDLPPNYSQQNDTHGDNWSNGVLPPNELTRAKRIYYAMANNLDYNFGRLLSALDNLGMSDDTIVVFTADHGEQFGAHGRRNKNIFYEEAARIPCLIRIKGVKPQKLASPISNVDFMPTLLELNNIPIPSDVEGMSVAGLITGQNDTEPEFAFLQNTGPCAVWGDGHEWRAVRDKQFTYAIFKKGNREELYDNLLDPYQMNNLINDKNYANVLALMKSRLTKKMQELNDTFPSASFYQENWIDDNRIILKTAKNG